ncbi:hypothetical protein [Tsuneonella sp. HG222]
MKLLFGALALCLAVPGAGKGYGPAPVEAIHYEMYRGDTLDVPIGREASWVEVDGNAVAAQILEGGKVRIVAIKKGSAKVSLKDGEALVWQAEVIVR